MAYSDTIRSLLRTGKMALNSAIEGAKYVLPYIKSALPIVTKFTSALQYLPVIGTAAKYIGTASEYLNNNIGVADSILGHAETLNSSIDTITSVVNQKSAGDMNEKSAQLAKVYQPSARVNQQLPPEFDAMRQYQTIF
jgi:hypothetical protein